MSLDITKFESKNWEPNNEEKKFIGETIFKTLEEGDNQIRILGTYVFRNIHYVPNGKRRYIVCSGDNCPLCNSGNTPRLNYYINIFDRKDRKVKILRFGVTIKRQLQNLSKKYGDLSKFDIIIIREGSGLDTKYTLMPAPPQDNIKLTKEDMQIISENFFDLEEIFRIPTPEQIKEMAMPAEDEDNNSNEPPNTQAKECFGSNFNPINPMCQKCELAVNCKALVLKALEEAK